VPRAVGLADEILTRWAPIVETLELISSSKGRFEVVLDGELVFSKAALGRHAQPGEIVAILEERVGPPIERD
jgi:selenoprotein W-related protein